MNTLQIPAQILEILNKIKAMAEVQSKTGQTDKYTVEIELLGEGQMDVEDVTDAYICCSSELQSNMLQSNLFNTQIATPFLEEHLSKSLLRSKRASQVRQGPPQAIHKVPGPIRKALRIGKYRKVIEVSQQVLNNSRNPEQIRKRETAQQFSIKVRRLSPRLNGAADEIDSRTIQKEQRSRISIIETRYHSLNKKLRMHFTEYKNVFPASPKKYRNSVESALLKEPNEANKKQLAPIKKMSLGEGYVDMPRKFRGANFLNIQSLKPSQRRESTINYLKKNCVMPQINEIIKVYGQRSQSPDKQPLVLIPDEQHPLSSSPCGRSTHSPLFPPANSRSQLSPKKISYRQKPFVPPFQRYYYRDFLWKINFAHNVEVDIPLEYQKSFKVFIGPGNNKMLVKGLMKRRTWWSLTEKSEDCHFAWTQIKIQDIFRNQKKAIVTYHCVEKPETPPKRPAKEIDHNEKILSQQDLQMWKKYFSTHRHIESKITEQILSRKKHIKKEDTKKINNLQLRMHNHFQNNYVIGNKKALFYTMSKYYQLTHQNTFDYLPTTFHIQSGLDDPTYMKFLNSYYDKARQVKKQQKEQGINPTRKLRNIWIVKPGEFTNRGTGITVCLTLDQVKNLIKTKQKHANGNTKTYIVQSYLDRPFLYCRRKFDIRHYMMITSVNGIIRGYWYQEGYIRTTSFQFTLKTNTTGVHLTNDAIQKYLPEYGKYEKGNKLSYADFQKYLEKEYGKKYNFYTDVYPTMKKMATDAVRASFLSIDKQKRQHNFQIFGMDFMIDQDFHPWLIQINTNPCLELSCPLLGRIIPAMVDNALRIGLDPIFPAPANLVTKSNYLHQNLLETNRFELVFDQMVDGPELAKLYGSSLYKPDKEIANISDDDEVYEDEGKEWEQSQ